MTNRRPIEAADAVRILRDLRAEKAGWRKTMDEARNHGGNPPAWFEQQDEYLAALDVAIGALAAPSKQVAAPPVAKAPATPVQLPAPMPPPPPAPPADRQASFL